jgi:hypothetical protein
MRLDRKLFLGVLIAVLVAGCAVPQPAQTQQVTPAVTPAQRQQPTRVPRPAATVAVAPSPTAVPTGTEQATPTATEQAMSLLTATPTAVPQPTVSQTTVPQMAVSQVQVPPTAVPPTATATQQAMSSQPSPTEIPLPTVALVTPPGIPTEPTSGGVGLGVLLPLDPHKYPAPMLLTPANNATYHVAQPVVHMVWSTTSNLMTFGQTAGCVSDATNFRRAFESYHLVIHSLDGKRPDQIQWTENDPEYYLNLTTVPAGRYSWSVSVVTLCESYVVGERNNFDQHKSTLQRTLVAPASPASASRVFNWVP